MSVDFQFEKITRETSTESLVELVKLCFNMDVDDAYFRWKYFDNPAGEVVAFIAKSEGKVAAFYGVIPEWYWVNGKKKLVYQSMDTMTHPGFRRLGLFAKLAKMCYDELARIDKDFVILGFPAPASHEGFVKKLGWSTLFVSKFWFCYSIVHKSVSVFTASNRKIELKPVDISSAELQKYFEKKRPLSNIEKFLDAPTLKWKVFQNRHKEYQCSGVHSNGEMIGLLVYHNDTSKSTHLLWTDFYDDSFYSSRNINTILKKLFSLTQRRCIYTWSPFLPIQKKSLTRNGFLTNPFNKGPFKDQLPFIILTNNGGEDAYWKNKEAYNFQGLMLD